MLRIFSWNRKLRITSLFFHFIWDYTFKWSFLFRNQNLDSNENLTNENLQRILYENCMMKFIRKTCVMWQISYETLIIFIYFTIPILRKTLAVIHCQLRHKYMEDGPSNLQFFIWWEGSSFGRIRNIYQNTIYAVSIAFSFLSHTIFQILS